MKLYWQLTLHTFSIISHVFKVLCILSGFVQFILPAKGLFEDISKIIFFSIRLAHSITVHFCLLTKIVQFFIYSFTI